MSPLVGYHATNPKCRESIRARGLLAGEPFKLSNTGRYRRRRSTSLQPTGLYVYSDDGSFDHPTYSKTGGILCEWGAGPGVDVWQVAYIGPILTDTFVGNALCLTLSVPPQHVTFITHVTGHVRGVK